MKKEVEYKQPITIANSKTGEYMLADQYKSKTVIPGLYREDRPKNSYEVLEAKLKKIKLAGGSVGTVACIYGDMKDTVGFVEEVITPLEGGFLLKLYGCTYLFRGHTSSTIVNQVATVKRTLVQTIRILMKFPFILIVPLLFLFRKRVTRAVVHWFAYIYHVSTEVDFDKLLKANEFNEPQRELLRVGTKFVNKIYQPINAPLSLLHIYEDRTSLRYQTQTIINFVVMMFEFDNAYRLRFQDIISNWNKDANVVSETKRLFDLVMSREKGMPEKLGVFKKAILFILIMSRPARRLLKEIMDELDTSKIAMNDSDKYFALSFTRYDTRGWTLKERQKMKDLIDDRLDNLTFSDSILSLPKKK